jgi:hypothetical protein
MKNHRIILILMLFLISISEAQSQRGRIGGMRSFGGSRNTSWGRVYNKPMPLKNTQYKNRFGSNSRSMLRPQRHKTHIVYKKVNPSNGKVYYGRASGYGNKKTILNRRDKNHHMNKKGYSKAMIVRSSKDKKAIRGLEDKLIRRNTERGRSGNSIAGISNRNKQQKSYWESAKKAFRLPKSW